MRVLRLRHLRGLFQCAAIHEIGDPRRPEAVVSDLRADPGRRRAALDHRIGVRLRQHRAREPAGASPMVRNSGPLGSSPMRARRYRYAGRYSLIVVAGQGVCLAALLAQPHPEAAPFRV